ncbi:MAG: 30S ribosomal protein S4 [Chloroflexi bacterium]|nr:30S ribosomal protein S4 [Chloroflexota bacterium]
MARYTGPGCRRCRHQNQKLMLKGERCASPKCALERKKVGAGGRTRGRPRKLSEYGVRLLEKQKVKDMYGMLERQMQRYFQIAQEHPGRTGEEFLRILETRLDNVVLRAGFADSLRQARQLVRHGHFTVNGRKLNVPSYLVKSGDVIAWKENKQKLFPCQNATQNVANRQVPAWLSVDRATVTAKVLTMPSREDIGSTINERLIIEFYSK